VRGETVSAEPRAVEASNSPSVAQLLLDLPDSLKIGRSVESVAAHEKELDEVAGDVSASDVEATGEVRKGEAIVDGDDVSDSIS
jgi:hypothetical protein